MHRNVHHNEPDAPVNNPQQPLGQRPDITERGSKGGKRVGLETTVSSVQGLDASDPHPAEEGKPYEARHPGGATPRTKDVGPNPAIHDGKAPPQPKNTGSGSE
jgi:hypothetical protein